MIKQAKLAGWIILLALCTGGCSLNALGSSAVGSLGWTVGQLMSFIDVPVSFLDLPDENIRPYQYLLKQR